MRARRWSRKTPIAVDGLTPMVRLLQQLSHSNQVLIEYHQQWKTFFKAQKLGYINEDGVITEKGKMLEFELKYGK